MSPKILNIYNNPKLQLVLDQAKLDIAESIYFHSSDINQEVYNYSWLVLNTNKKQKIEKETHAKKIVKKA